MGGGCCIGNCCVANCGFCCIGDFFSCSDSGCCVGNCGVSSSSSTPKEDHATKTANELADMQKKSAADAKKQEEDIIADVNESMEDFIKWLQKVNKENFDGKNLNINIDKIRELNEELRNKIVGFIGKRLSDKIIMTDPEVSTILAEPDDKKRKKNFDDFYNRQKREAVNELLKIDGVIVTSIREQSESIEREIQNRLRELNNNIREETRAFDELKKLKEQEDSRVAEKQVEYMYYMNLCDIMFDELKTSSLDLKTGSLNSGR